MTQRDLFTEETLTATDKAVFTDQTQERIIMDAFEAGAHIRGSEVLDRFNISEPSFKRIVCESIKRGVNIQHIKLTPKNGGHKYYEYFLAKENNSSLSASNLSKAVEPDKLAPSVSKLKIDTSGAATEGFAQQADTVCQCTKSKWMKNGKCTACGVVRTVPLGWFGN